MLTLIIGGARSGKSDFAQQLALSSGRPVLFVATMEPRDDETRARIAAHQAARPSSWRTVEAPINVAGALRSDARSRDFVILDCVTMWVSNVLLSLLGDVDAPSPDQAQAALGQISRGAEDFTSWAAQFDGEIAVVSNEVGMGVVPAYPLGRIYRDALGAANRIVARRADAVYQTVAGLAVDVKRAGAVLIDAPGERGARGRGA